MNTYTTIEQSKRLVELGLDPNTCDGIYAAKVKDWEGKEVKNPRYRIHVGVKLGKFIVQNFEEIDEIPAWSFGNLLELLPRTIECDNIIYDLTYNFRSNSISYREKFGPDTLIEFFIDSDPYENIIVCFNWLVKNGFINKEVVN